MSGYSQQLRTKPEPQVQDPEDLWKSEDMLLDLISVI